jgi:hypothetical protein
MTNLENAVANSLGLDEFSDAAIFGDEFDQPAETPEIARREVKFDGWGRYANLPPLPGETRSRPWTRASTLKDILTDKRNLDLWNMRQVLRGVAMRPELIRKLRDAVNDEDTDFDSKQIKGWLNSIAEQAKDVAGSNKGSDAGTSFHSVAELYDAGNPFTIGELLDRLDNDQARMLAAYAHMLHAHEITPVKDLMERVVAVPEIEVVGRLDRVYEDQGVLKIGDLKSQKWEPGAFDGIPLCVQLAIYANASWMLDEEAWEWRPFPDDIDKTTGLIMWVPATQPGVTEVYDIDLEWGWDLAKESYKIRNDWRKDKSRVKIRRKPPVALDDLR